MSERYQNGDTVEVKTLPLIDSANAAVTGSATIVFKVRRESDGFFLDFNDNTFKASGHVAITSAMTETNLIQAPGVYEGAFDSTGFADDEYLIVLDDTSATAVNVQQLAIALVGGFVDNLDAKLSVIRDLVKLTGNLDVLIDGGPGNAAVQVNTKGFVTRARARGFANAAAKIAATLGAADDADSEVSRVEFLFTGAAAGNVAGSDAILQSGDGELELGGS